MHRACLAAAALPTCQRSMKPGHSMKFNLNLQVEVSPSPFDTLAART
jgi:hypothetical protein